jgi:hypothetical protein
MGEHKKKNPNFKSKLIFITILLLVCSDLSYINKVRTLKEKYHYCYVFSKIIKIHSTHIKKLIVS